MNNSARYCLFHLLRIRLLSPALKEHLDERVQQRYIEENIAKERVHARALMFLNKDNEESDDCSDHTESKLNNLKKCNEAFPAGHLSGNCPL